MTAHYNVFFNGNESFKLGEKKVEAINKENYTQMLAVFPSSKKENLDGVSGEMDIAIEKGGKLIKLHSMTAKPNSSSYARKFKNRKEFNNWVDDAYLLVAKAQFYKKDYQNCINTCITIIRDYSDTPSKYDAVIWMGRSLIQLKQYGEAQTVLDGYDISTGAPRKLLSSYMATVSDLNIRQEKYADAVPFMKGALEAARKKSQRIRYQYILAQLYHRTGNMVEAAKAYESVINMNPTYEIAFNAKVNRGSILLAGANSGEIKKQLNKLLKNKKNIDFQDRIYYALGKVNLSEKDEKEASVNFRRSIDTSKDNPIQKAISYIEIGNISYTHELYKAAYLNYDSAVVILDKESKEYTAIAERHHSLKNLVAQLDIVQFEDSVQSIAKLSASGQEAFVDKMIASKQKRAAELAKAREEAAQNGYQNEFESAYGNSSKSTEGSTEGLAKWYFYNPVILTQGKSEFERRWGSRKLEDNWRRSNKEAAMSDPSTEQFPSDPDNDPASRVGNKKGLVGDSLSSKKGSADGDKILSKAEYLKNIPNTAEQLAASNDRIENGLSQMSRVYANQLHNYPNAVEALNELLKRFPNSLLKPDYLMSLYQAYLDSNDTDGMEKVKAQILREYPASEFALYLSDPDYFKKLDKRKRETDSIYQITYSAYLNNDFEQSLSTSESTLAAMPKNHLADKFIFLKALSNAKTGNTQQFKVDLNNIVQNYPASECFPMAEVFLSQLDKGLTPIKVANLAKILATDTLKNKGDHQDINSELRYQFPDSTAMLVVIVANGNCDKNRLTYNVADYNFSRFIISDFELSSQNWMDRTILMIEPFANGAEAMDYFYSIREHKYLFDVSNSGSVSLFVISKANLATLTTGKELESYLKFFNKNYLKRND